MPGPGELSIATEVAGLCGTDIQMLRGLRQDPAPVIGHEGIARIVTAGPGVEGRFAPGMLVMVNPTHPSDPGCLLGHTIDGLLQERTLLPAAAVDGGQVIALPEATDCRLAPLLEPLAVVGYALEQLRRFRPATLLIVGDGTIGHLAVRAAGRWLGTHVRTVLVHHTPAGRAFSQAAPFRADLLVGGEPAPSLSLAAGPVAALLATPRDATVSATEMVLRALTGQQLTIDLVGGVPPGASTPLLPGADLATVRAANCAGLPNPAIVTTLGTASGRVVRVFGHRGVANHHLADAATELARHPDRYRDLITHRTGLDGAVPIMRQLAQTYDRVVHGRRLIKLGVHIGHYARHDACDGA